MSSDRYVPNGITLTDREREILTILVEECAEVIHAATKLLRFGRENRPDDGKSNCEILSIEIGDLHCMLDMAIERQLADGDKVAIAYMRKQDKLRFYMQSKE